MNGVLHICLENGDVVAVLANEDSPSAIRLANFTTNRLPWP